MWPGGGDSISTLSTRTYIYIPLCIDAGFGEDGVLAGQYAHVDIGLCHLAIAEGQDVMLANDKHFSIDLDKGLWISAGGGEIFYIIALTAGDDIIEPTPPQAATGVFKQAAEISALDTELS